MDFLFIGEDLLLFFILHPLLNFMIVSTMAGWTLFILKRTLWFFARSHKLSLLEVTNSTSCTIWYRTYCKIIKICIIFYTSFCILQNQWLPEVSFCNNIFMNFQIFPEFIIQVFEIKSWKKSETASYIGIILQNLSISKHSSTFFNLSSKNSFVT